MCFIIFVVTDWDGEYWFLRIYMCCLNWYIRKGIGFEVISLWLQNWQMICVNKCTLLRLHYSLYADKQYAWTKGASHCFSNNCINLLEYGCVVKGDSWFSFLYHRVHETKLAIGFLYHRFSICPSGRFCSWYRLRLWPQFDVCIGRVLPVGVVSIHQSETKISHYLTSDFIYKVCVCKVCCMDLK